MTIVKKFASSLASGIYLGALSILKMVANKDELTMNYQQAYFLTSVAKINQLPSDTGAEVAFAGRSNAGKSSALNTLTHQTNLARVSKTPGRTQLINFFELEEGKRIVDLPGYGYAKVPEKIRIEWGKLIDAYLIQRQSLNGLILVMDIRHPLKPFDLQMLQWSDTCQLPIHILLTKSDKLKFGAAKNSLLQIEKAISAFSQASVQLFSSLKKQGVGELKTVINNWLAKS